MIEITKSGGKNKSCVKKKKETARKKRRNDLHVI